MAGTRHESRPVVGRRAGAAVLAIASAGMIGLVIYDVFSNTLVRSAPLLLALVQIFVPLTMAVLVAAAAFSLYHDDGPAVDVWIVCAWALVGVAGVAVTVLWTVGFQRLQGAVQPAFVVGYAAMWGAIVGLLVGFYDVRRRRRRRDIERINELNAELREVNTAMVTADSREEIERDVCDRLTNVAAFTYAWFGERTEGPERFVVRAASGVDPERVSSGESADGESVQDDALRSGEPALSRRPGPGESEAVAAVPVAYEEFPYGVLTVGVAPSFEVGPFERRVLANLGRQVGDAIHALRAREALVADSVVELTFGVSGDDRFVTAATAAVGGRLELRTAQYSEGTLYAFYDVVDADPEGVAEVARSHDAVAEVTVVGEATEDGGRLQVVHDSPLYAVVTERGGGVRAVSAAGGSGELRVRLPRSADVRETVEAVTAACPGAELVSRKDRPGSVSGESDPATWSDSSLTDRQLLVARTAYHGGYFESPRRATGEELAATLDISAPTFHDHLRSAEQKLFGTVFGRTEPPEGSGG